AAPLGGLGRRREPLVLCALARHPRGAGLRRRRGAADAAPLQGSAGASIAAQRGRDQDRAVGRRGPRHAFRQRRAGTLARRDLAARCSQRPRVRSAGAADAVLAGSADAAALAGTRSRPLLAFEEAAALNAHALRRSHASTMVPTVYATSRNPFHDPASSQTLSRA